MTRCAVRMGVAGVVTVLLLAATGSTASADAPAPLDLGAVRIVPRCLGFGENAGPELKISYAISGSARVNFTVQQRTAPGLPTPRRCPSVLQAANTLVTYASVAAADVTTAAGPGVATVQQPGSVTAAGIRSASAARPPLSVVRTIRATKGRHTIALLRTQRATAAFAPGRYRVLIQAFGEGGAISRMATVWFWVLRSG